MRCERFSYGNDVVRVGRGRLHDLWEVRTISFERRSAGMHSITWDGTNDAGEKVTSGVYLYRLEAGDFAQTRAMTLLK